MGWFKHQLLVEHVSNVFSFILTPSNIPDFQILSYVPSRLSHKLQPCQVPLFLALQVRYPLEWGGHVWLPQIQPVAKLWVRSCGNFASGTSIHGNSKGTPPYNAKILKKYISAYEDMKKNTMNSA